MITVTTDKVFATPLTLDEAKTMKLQEVKVSFEQKCIKPRVLTPMGYYVDGGRSNKDDFKSKWEIMLDTDTTTVKDADNNYHVGTTRAEMKLIWEAIILNGESILSWKWGKENEINACTTLAELEAVVI